MSKINNKLINFHLKLNSLKMENQLLGTSQAGIFLAPDPPFAAACSTFDFV